MGIQLHYKTTFAGTLYFDIKFSFVVICTFAKCSLADSPNSFSSAGRFSILSASKLLFIIQSKYPVKLFLA